MQASSTGVNGTTELTTSAKAPDRAGYFRQDIQGLRAVAVLLVVLYHAHLNVLSGGYIGVDIFFVISGYVIAGVLLRERGSSGRISLLNFYSRRIRRIIPAASLVIICVLALAAYGLTADIVSSTASDARWAAVFLSNFHFAQTGADYLDANRPPSLLQNFWTLSVEEQFYLVFPSLLILVGWFRSPWAFRQRALVVLALLSASSFIWSIVQTSSNPNFAYFSPFTRAWEFGLGAIVAVSSSWWEKLPAVGGAVLTWVGLAAIGVCAVSFTAATPYPGAYAALPVLATVLIIGAGGSARAGGAQWLLGKGALVWIGALSYSLYLWHWPLLIFFTDRSSRFGQSFVADVPIIALSFVLSIITYYAVENPLRRSRYLRSSSTKTVMAGAGMILTTILVSVLAPASEPAPEAGVPVPLSPAAVSSLVQQAPHIRGLPAHLDPTFGGLSSDWGGPPSQCFVEVPSVDQPAPNAACTFGDLGASRTMVLDGDSHAAMWFVSIDGLAQRYGWRLVVFAKAACPVAAVITAPYGWGSPTGTFSACIAWRRAVEKRLEGIKPSLIVVSESTENASGTGLAFSATQWTGGLRASLRQFNSIGAKTVVLGNIPNFNENGPECLERGGVGYRCL